jgi:hypothetical protein
MRLYELLQQDFDVLSDVRVFRADSANASREAEATALESRLRTIDNDLASLYRIVEGADVGPTSQVVEAAGMVACAGGGAGRLG